MQLEKDLSNIINVRNYSINIYNLNKNILLNDIFKIIDGSVNNKKAIVIKNSIRNVFTNNDDCVDKIINKFLWLIDYFLKNKKDNDYFKKMRINNISKIDPYYYAIKRGKNVNDL